ITGPHSNSNDDHGLASLSDLWSGDYPGTEQIVRDRKIRNRIGPKRDFDGLLLGKANYRERMGGPQRSELCRRRFSLRKLAISLLMEYPGAVPNSRCSRFVGHPNHFNASAFHPGVRLSIASTRAE